VEIDRLHALYKFEQTLWRQGFKCVAGVDEVGRGPLAGPVVAAAVVFPGEILISGVNDSKLVPADKREDLCQAIRAQAASVGVGEASVEEIDRFNILQATFLAMRRALSDLSIIPDYLLIDGNQPVPDTVIPQQSIVHGDGLCFSIAAASIVAKVHRDRIMKEYHQVYPQYGFDRHKGYGTRRHVEALKLYGSCEIHRRSFHVKEIFDLFHETYG
jgi:ribonuclease HII